MFSKLNVDLAIESVTMPDFDEKATLFMTLNFNEEKQVSPAALFNQNTKSIQFDHKFQIEESIDDEND
jgi:hypothetical protein